MQTVNNTSKFHSIAQTLAIWAVVFYAAYCLTRLFPGYADYCPIPADLVGEVAK